MAFKDNLRTDGRGFIDTRPVSLQVQLVDCCCFCAGTRLWFERRDLPALPAAPAVPVAACRHLVFFKIQMIREISQQQCLLLSILTWPFLCSTMLCIAVASCTGLHPSRIPQGVCMFLA